MTKPGATHQIVIAGAGYLFGQHWGRLERDIRRFDVVVAILVVLAAAFWWWRNRRKARVENGASSE